jgi:GntR family transcriptional regulator
MTEPGTRAVVAGNRDGSVPRRKTRQLLWRQVRDDLVRRLNAGEFTADLPGEMALADSYGVSRQTVRQALRELREAGLVDAGPGRRSRPAEQADLAEPLGALYEVFTQLRESGVSVHGAVRTLRVGPDAVIASRIGLDESTPLLYLHRLWHAGNRPLALDHAWLPVTVAGMLLDTDVGRVGLYRQLATRAGVRLVSGSEWLHAIVPSAAQRALLHMPPHVAAVAVDRIGRTASGPIEWRHVVIRGDRFSIGADFSARTSYRMHVRAAASANTRDLRRCGP